MLLQKINPYGGSPTCPRCGYFDRLESFHALAIYSRFKDLWSTERFRGATSPRHQDMRKWYFGWRLAATWSEDHRVWDWACPALHFRVHHDQVYSVVRHVYFIAHALRFLVHWMDGGTSFSLGRWRKLKWWPTVQGSGHYCSTPLFCHKIWLIMILRCSTRRTVGEDTLTVHSLYVVILTGIWHHLKNDSTLCSCRNLSY